MIRSKTSNLKGSLLLADRNKQLEEANAELDRQNKLKDRLLAIISHDIRAPLYSLKSMLHLLTTNSLTANELQEMVFSLDRQVEQLSGFLENLLQWIKSHGDRIEIKRESILLHRAAQQTIELLLPIANRKHIQIHCDISDQLVIYSDVEIIKLILRNLISNAIKFCHSNDQIYVSAQREHSLTRISVKDTGPGISAEKMSNLFNVSNLSTKGTKNEIGMGLGLTLCREFVESLGGKIHVTSIEGKGSCFEFTVPFRPIKQFQNGEGIESKSVKV